MYPQNFMTENIYCIRSFLLCKIKLIFKNSKLIYALCETRHLDYEESILVSSEIKQYGHIAPWLNLKNV